MYLPGANHEYIEPSSDLVEHTLLTTTTTTVRKQDTPTGGLKRTATIVRRPNTNMRRPLVTIDNTTKMFHHRSSSIDIVSTDPTVPVENRLRRCYSL
jgi:hypothetical protein